MLKLKAFLPNFSQIGNYIRGNTFRIFVKDDPNHFFECTELFACILSDKILYLKLADQTISEISVLHQNTIKYFKMLYSQMI